MVKNMSGIVFNGLYLVQKEPSKGDKGLLVNGKYFIPVTNESSGAVASYYKCASVTPGVSGAVIEVTGDTTYGCNGTYTIVDATATGKNRTWRTSDGVWEIRNTNATAGIDRWCIFDVASDIMKIRSVMTTVPDNPWEVTSWQNDTSPYAYPDLVLTPYDTAKTWSGYKAVFDSTAGTWSFESDITAGLTYHGYTPTVGNIYSSDTTIAITNMYTSNFPAFDKLKYYWSLDGNTVDYDKISNVGMVAANNVQFGITGKFGTCFGTSSSGGKNTGSYTNADIPTDVISNGFTCNFWCNISSIGGDSPGFIGERTNDSFANGLFSILLNDSSSRDIMIGIGNTALWNCFSGTGVSLGQTHMITLTHDTVNKIITAYLDGAVYGTPYVYSSTFSYTSRALSLLPRYINGWIDEVAIWQAYALDANEVQILYNNGAGKFL